MILVVGATGILGGLITQKLLADDKEVRILVRHDSPAEGMALERMATSPKALIEAGAEPFYGDLKDRDTLDGLVMGSTPSSPPPTQPCAAGRTASIRSIARVTAI